MAQIAPMAKIAHKPSPERFVSVKLYASTRHRLKAQAAEAGVTLVRYVDALAIERRPNVTRGK